jgi:urate oxidase
VSVQLGGKRLETTFYNGDNRDVVPTDTMKNVVFVLASQHDLLAIESFASFVAAHFLGNYAQVDSVFVKILDHAWARLESAGGAAHAFTHVRGGPETRFVELKQTRGKPADIVAGFTGLALLKTCGSAFKNFNRCKHTTLPDADDRLLSTSVNCRYKFLGGAAPADFNAVYALVKQILIEHFADFVSLSVQQLMYKVAVVALQRIPALADVWLQMPNIHFYDFKLPELGYPVNNTMIVFTDPNGLIEGRVTRKQLTGKY